MSLCAALIVVLAVAGGALLIRRLDKSVGRDTLLAPSARAVGAEAAVTGPLNFLVIGSDFRTWNPTMGQRSDTIIVVHVTRALDRAYLVSVPRDLRVEIPPMPALGYPGGVDKINSAFEFGGGGNGGVQLLSHALTALMGIQFDGAAVVDFDGLRKAVDVLGGVELCVDARTVSTHTGKVFEPGCHLMSSAQVLDYLRQRNFPDGDFTRQRHQQQFLKAFFERALDAGVLTNPLKLDELLRACAGSVTVDTGQMSLPALAFALRRLHPDHLTGIKIPFYYDADGKISYVVTAPDADGLFAAIRTDSLQQWAGAHPRWVNQI